MTKEVATIDFDEVDEGLRIIRILGRLDIQGVNAIDAKLAFLASSAKHRIVVDLSGLEFIASIGIRSLVGNAKAQQHHGGRLVLLVGNNEPVTKVLVTMGINNLIPMFADSTKAQVAALA